MRVFKDNSYFYYTTSSNYVNLGVLAVANLSVEVQANCSAGQSSNWVGTYFSNLSCSTVVSVTNLLQSAYTNSAWLSWQTNCGTLELRWRPAGGNWTTVSVSGTNYQLTGLQNNTTYEWQLRATCNGPNDFAPVSFFRTNCKTTASFGYITAASTQISADFYNNNSTATELRYRPQGGA